MNVSIIMATYNGEKYIRNQLDSIIPYMEDEDELLISDDGSTDDTISIINEYKNIDSRIVLVNGPRKGVINNFENAISHTTKEIILFADQDDIWLPEKLPTIKSFFANAPYKLVLHDMYMESDKEINGDRRGVQSFKIRKRRHGVIYNWLFSGYYGCCMAFTKELKNVIYPFSKYTNMYDQWIGLIAEYMGTASFIDKPLIIHRIHGDNLSQKRAFFERLEIRYQALLAFIDGVKRIRRIKKKI